MGEFPGGKIEIGEAAESALKHEIQEELGEDMTSDNFFCTIDYDYPSFHLTMHCYLCNIESGEIELREHNSSCWPSVESLGSIDWLPADKKVIEALKQMKRRKL